MTNCDHIHGISARDVRLAVGVVYHHNFFVLGHWLFKVCTDLPKHQSFENHTSYPWRIGGGGGAKE